MPLKSANRSGVSLAGLVLTLLRGAKQIVDQHLRLDLLLDVERRRMNDEIAPILLILPAPDELGIEVAIAPLVGHADGADSPFLQYRLILGSGNILPLGLVVLEGFDGFPRRNSGCVRLRHGYVS